MGPYENYWEDDLRKGMREGKYFLAPKMLIPLARKIGSEYFENMMFQCQLASCIAIQPKALPWLGKWLVKVKETCKVSSLVNWASRSPFPSHRRALGRFPGLVAVWHWNIVFSNNWHIFLIIHANFQAILLDFAHYFQFWPRLFFWNRFFDQNQLS